MSRKKNTRQSTIMQEYRAERRKAQRRISGLEERGYYFEKPILKEPPKRITRKSIEALKKSTQLDTLYSKAKYYTNEGEITGTQARHLERQIAARKGAETRRVKQQEYVRYADDYNFELDRIEFKYNEAKKKAVEDYNKHLADIRNNKYLNKYERYTLYNEEATRYSETLDDIENERAEKIIKIPEQIEQKRKDEEAVERIRREQAEREARELASFDEEKRAKIEQYIIEGMDYQQARSFYEDTYENDWYYEPEEEYDTSEFEGLKDFDRNEWGERQNVNIGNEEPRISSTILDNIIDMINTWEPEPSTKLETRYEQESARATMRSLLSDAIDDEGYDNVAARIERSASEVINVVETILLKSTSDPAIIAPALVRFATIIKGSALTVGESKDISDLQENYFEEMMYE